MPVPSEMQACAENLQTIHAAIKKYAQDQGEPPNWLSDLVPDYLGKEALLCPTNSKRIKAQYCPDPDLPCSYTEEFSPTRINSRWVFRKWKKQQVEEFGDVVPIVRCIDHGILSSKHILPTILDDFVSLCGNILYVSCRHR